MSSFIHFFCFWCCRKGRPSVSLSNDYIYNNNITYPMFWNVCHNDILTYNHMDVSENNGTPKSSILIGFSIINHPFWGTPIGDTHIKPVFFSHGKCENRNRQCTAELCADGSFRLDGLEARGNTQQQVSTRFFYIFRRESQTKPWFATIFILSYWGRSKISFEEAFVFFVPICFWIFWFTEIRRNGILDQLHLINNKV